MTSSRLQPDPAVQQLRRPAACRSGIHDHLVHVILSTHASTAMRASMQPHASRQQRSAAQRVAGGLLAAASGNIRQRNRSWCLVLVR